MGRDTKIGLVVVLSILFLFGAIVVRKLQTSQGPAATAANTGTGAETNYPPDSDNGQPAEPASTAPSPTI